MKKIIVTTTINPPTKAIKKFDAMPDWQLVNQVNNFKVDKILNFQRWMSWLPYR